MKAKNKAPFIIKSIAELHRLFLLPDPKQPLISVIDYQYVQFDNNLIWKSFTYDFYSIVIKKGADGKFKYGQSEYDFDDGVMFFTKPGQVFSIIEPGKAGITGYMLLIHPDFFRKYLLNRSIHEYGFFSYRSSEALHLSEEEDQIICALLRQIKFETTRFNDDLSQDIIVSQIELLLNYANRFYNRQFNNRKLVNHGILKKVEQLLSDYFNDKEKIMEGIPTVNCFAEALNISADYLSDILRNLTGQNMKQHIHIYLMEKAKEMLGSTELTVTEIAYSLGFRYPQSFNKLFKNKMHITPLEFRQSLKQQNHQSN